MGAVAGGSALAVAALYAFSKAVSQATDAQISAMRQYAQVSASMAVVLAERDVREMRRNMEKGDALAGSTKMLVDAEQERKETTKPIEILADKIYNGFLTVGNKIVTELAAPLADLAKVIDKWIEDGKEKDIPLHSGSQEFWFTYWHHQVKLKQKHPWFTRKDAE